MAALGNAQGTGTASLRSPERAQQPRTRIRRSSSVDRFISYAARKPHCIAPSGLFSYRESRPQGVAPGWHVSALSGRIASTCDAWTEADDLCRTTRGHAPAGKRRSVVRDPWSRI